MTRPRMFFYVQHLLGIGHLRRAAAIARAIERKGVAVTFVSGGEPVPSLDLGRADLVQLPPARAGDHGFGSIVDSEGRPIGDAWKSQRRAALLDAFDRCLPDILLIELYPFGRRPFRFELGPLLDAAAARRPRPPVLCSVRDILVDKNDPQRTAEIVDIIRNRFDLVLVHGDPQLIEFGATFPAADQIAGHLNYTGYVVSESLLNEDSKEGCGEVLGSAGGGAVGAPLLHAAIRARPMTSLSDRKWRLITGPNLPYDDFRALTAAAGADVTIERFRDDFQVLLRNCRVSLSQAGYNTVMELLAARVRAVVVPFSDGGESEQPVRARLLAKRGLLTVVEPDTLTPARLAAAMDSADRAPLPAAALKLNMSGADGSARAVIEMIERFRNGRLAGPATNTERRFNG